MKKLRSLFSGIHWMNHFFAFLGTCAGVLFAFFLTDYQERRSNQERLEKVMAQLKLEIEQNHAALENHSETLSTQIASMRKIKPLLREDTLIIASKTQMDHILEHYPGFFEPEEHLPYEDTLFQWRGDLNVNFNMPGLSEIAWKNAQALDIMHLVDFDTSYKLFSLYSFQERLREESIRDFEEMKEGIKSKKSEVEFLNFIFGEYLSGIRILAEFEKSILDYYQINLENLKEQY